MARVDSVVSTPRRRVRFLDCGEVLSYTGGDNSRGRDGYRAFMQAGLGKGLESPLELGKGHGVVGGEEFIKWVKSTIRKENAARREQPALRELGRVLEPEELISQYVQMVGKKREDICRKGTQLIERAMLMELLYRYCNLPQPEVGRLLGGIDYSAVSQSRRRLQAALARDARLKVKFGNIVASLFQMSRIKI